MNETVLEPEEGTVDIRNLCLSILRRWRVILILAIVFAVLLGGLKLVRNAMADPTYVLSEDERAKTQDTIASNEQQMLTDETNIATYRAQIADLEEALASYELLLEEAQAEELSEAMVDSVLSLTDTIVSTRSSLLSQNNAIDRNQKEIDSLLETNEELAAQMEEMTSRPLKSGVGKRTILGLAAGIVLAVVWLVLCYAADKTLRTEYEVKERFGLPVLGVVRFPVKKGKKRRGLDLVFDKLLGDYTEFSPEQQYAFTAARLQVMFRGQSHIRIAGTMDPAALEQFCAGVSAALPEGACTLQCMDNPMSNPEAMLHVTDGPLVLVEQVHGSRRKALEELVHFLTLAKAPLQGVLVIRGTL